MPADAAYQVRHGAGYSEFRHNSHGLLQSWRIHVDGEAPVKLCRLRLTNAWPQARRITATCYVEWVLGNARADNASFIVGDYDQTEEHTSELQSLMRISYAVFCLNKKKPNITTNK